MDDKYEQWKKQFHHNLKPKHQTNGPSTSGLNPSIQSSKVKAF